MARGLTRGRTRLVAIVASVGLGLAAVAGCGSGGGIKDASGGSSSGKDCGDLRIAVNPWTGYVANAHVIGYLAKTKLGCNVTYPDVKEEVGWAGMASGSIDTIVENWGHPDLVKKYIDEQKSVVDAGPTGGKGIIGWYVPPWMAQKYPDITDWKNLNKYAGLFKTSESGGKGQLLDGDPSYVTNDEALVKNLKLNYKVVVGGSEAGLIQSFKSAEKNKTPLLAYFYEPQWFFSEMKLVHVNLPTYKDGCDADAAKVNCDYPPYELNKLIAKKFDDSGSPAVDLVKKFSWSNDDQNVVAKYIAADGMSPDDAAKKWVDANPDKVKAWLGS
ncbi:MAG: glycine/betaine transporter substrate-binding protein [Marmoricola sp.]|jgi:glycine betaine/proline transport system substrate-binding protein|nr:glycine/betaine transporter substrate-binding protein [Marmoricola sp.]